MATEQAATPRILVIDDDKDTREVLEEALVDFGYELRTAASGGEGITIAQAWRPSIILCDLGMPGMTGYETAVHLQELGIDPLRLIALTGYDDDEDRQRALKAGFDAHLVKGTAQYLDNLEAAVPRLAPARLEGGPVSP